ncbi:methylmalonyl-CoA epimerase [Sulfidibacter corallicola]
MMKKIDHIGIAVPELDAAIEQYQTLGFDFDHVEEVPEQKVKTAFFELGDAHVELLEATEPDSAIAKFLGKRGPGIHHICVEVDDIEAALAEYRAAGVRLVNEEPVIGAGGHRVAFVHPKATHGVLLELLERRSTDAD